MKRLFIKIFFIVLFLAVIFYSFPVYRIDGTSMNYGLVEGDMVITYRYFGAIERGDMLTVRHPDDPKKRLYIKRCVALPGDKYFQKDRIFYLQLEGNSTKTEQMLLKYDLESMNTDEGRYIKEPFSKYYGVVHNRLLKVPSELIHIPISTIPQDQYFMLGDYRDNSADSRFFGAVPRSWIRSKVIYFLKKPHSWMELLNIEEADR